MIWGIIFKQISDSNRKFSNLLLWQEADLIYAFHSRLYNLYSYLIYTLELFLETEMRLHP